MNELERSTQELDIYGFTVVDGVLEEREIERLREALIRCEREVGRETEFLGAGWMVGNLPTLDPVFFPLIDHPHVLPLVEHYLGKSLILGSLNSRAARPGDPDQQFHSDVPQHVLNSVSPAMMNTVWMIDDFSPANGATRVVPGSHRSGFEQPPEGMDVKHFVQVEAPAGSVLIINGQCWHAAGANKSERDRRAIFAHYRKSVLLFQYDPQDGFPAEWYGQLTERQKELMRMTEGLGTLHPAEMIWKPGNG